MWKFPFRLRGDESTSSSCTLEEIEDELSPNGKEETREVRWCRFR